MIAYDILAPVPAAARVEMVTAAAKVGMENVVSMVEMENAAARVGTVNVSARVGVVTAAASEGMGVASKEMEISALETEYTMVIACVEVGIVWENDHASQEMWIVDDVEVI